MNFSQFFASDFWTHLLEINRTPWQIFISVLDIAIVALVIYRLIRFVQGSRLMILIRGLVIFLVAYVLASVLNLPTMRWLLNQVIVYAAIALVIIFQPEIRTALERLGHTTHLFVRTKGKSSMTLQIEAYEKSFDYMAKRKIGALIAIERSQTLDEYAATGIRLDADISSGLIINIFIPNTPLHDGAVIVKGNKIAVTSAYLPLTDRMGIDKQFGTRHRAAIGLSEVSDALILVVSEETGGISVAYKGVLMPELSADEFHTLLVEHLSADVGSGDNAKLWTGFFSHKEEKNVR
ncbi:MAG: diadenylate cyclase CdaA [Streptococcaceae bacterium]|jgi:diadenylate cyclase|nr:diadenylate cyclase CdaA [Streptococcaceae bacterium]